jgi:hypothetical protein
MTTAVLVFIVTVYSAVVLFTAWSLIQTRSELDRRIDELTMERRRLRETEKQATELVGKVTPLIEKTDWMTGRWNGQFDTLVRLENQRNAAVDTARQAIWEIPIVRDHIAKSLTFGEDITVSEPTENNGASK